MSKSKKWPELGIITKNVVKDKEGNVVKDKNGNPVTRLAFKLNDDVTILVKGEVVETSRYGRMSTPVEEVESLFKNGVIKEEEIEQKREKAKDINTWLRYKVHLPPPKVE